MLLLILGLVMLLQSGDALLQLLDVLLHLSQQDGAHRGQGIVGGWNGRVFHAFLSGLRDVLQVFTKLQERLSQLLA